MVSSFFYLSIKKLDYSVLTVYFVLLLAGCSGSAVPISDIIHPEVTNNIDLSGFAKEYSKLIEDHKKELVEHRKNEHSKEEELLKTSLERVIKLHEEAEKAAQKRYEDITTRVDELHRRHLKIQRKDNNSI